MNIYLVFLLTYPFVVVTHELGHYFVARWIGAKVKEVCFGAGRTVYSWTMGETVFKIRLFPISGYTLMKSKKENCRRRAARRETFSSKPAGKRILVYAAGSAANMLCAAVIWAALSCWPSLRDINTLRYVMITFQLAGVWSLVPFLKTDGERILELIVEGIFRRMKENRKQ